MIQAPSTPHSNSIPTHPTNNAWNVFTKPLWKPCKWLCCWTRRSYFFLPKYSTVSLVDAHSSSSTGFSHGTSLQQLKAHQNIFRPADNCIYCSFFKGKDDYECFALSWEIFVAERKKVLVILGAVQSFYEHEQKLTCLCQDFTSSNYSSPLN